MIPKCRTRQSLWVRLYLSQELQVGVEKEGDWREVGVDLSGMEYGGSVWVAETLGIDWVRVRYMAK